MKITQVTYRQSNFDPTRRPTGRATTIEMSATVEKGETSTEALEKLRKVVKLALLNEEATYRKAKQIVEDSFNFSGKDIEDAKKYIERVEKGVEE